MNPRALTSRRQSLQLAILIDALTMTLDLRTPNTFEMIMMLRSHSSL